MPTIQVSEQTKQDLDGFKEKYGHTSIDSVIKVLFSQARAGVEMGHIGSLLDMINAPMLEHAGEIFSESLSGSLKKGRPDPIFESLAPNEILIMNYLPKTEEYEVATNVGGALKIERVRR